MRAVRRRRGHRPAAVPASRYSADLLRGFAAGSALLVGARVGVAGVHVPTSLTADGLPDPLQPSIWLAIDVDGSVRIWTHRSEMGTGIRTALPQDLPPGTSVTLQARLETPGQAGTYSVEWFDPRQGGPLRDGSVTEISAGGTQSLGNPASGCDDWAVLLRGALEHNDAPPVW